MMSDVTSMVCSSYHWMTHVINDEYKSPILGLWNDHSMLEGQSPFLEHYVSASCSLDSSLNFGGLRLLSNYISMNSSTVHRNLALYLKLCPRYKVLHFCPSNFSIFENKFFKLSVISKRNSFHSSNILVFCGCEQAV